VERLSAENAALREASERTTARLKLLEVLDAQALEENARLRAENAELKAGLKEALARIEQLERQSPGGNSKLNLDALQGDLQHALERIAELERAKLRQAAPFRRPRNEGPKKKPGRKPGHRGARRPRPPHIDQEIEVPLPACPHCLAELLDRRPLIQIIEEIPELRPLVTRLITWLGTCQNCGEVHSSHPLQVSLAQGAAGVHLGPRAAALATVLNSHYGLTTRKTCAILKQAFGLSLSPGGLIHLRERIAQRAKPDYQELLEQIRASYVVYADETSWYVGQPNYWLWVFTTPQYTYYHVDESRGRPVVASILGEDFDGVLVTDCASMYKGLPVEQHKCVAHHLRKLRELLLREDTKDKSYLETWKIFWQEVIDLTHARDKLPDDEFAAHRATLEARRRVLMEQEVTQEADRKFLTRMKNAEPHLLGCLYHEVEATNNIAERAVRPAVIARKVSCGNKTPRGAATWQILASLCATFAQQGQDLLAPFIGYAQLCPC
jgi:hypothetical protein